MSRPHATKFTRLLQGRIDVDQSTPKAKTPTRILSQEWKAAGGFTSSRPYQSSVVLRHSTRRGKLLHYGFPQGGPQGVIRFEAHDARLFLRSDRLAERELALEHCKVRFRSVRARAEPRRDTLAQDRTRGLER